MEKCYKCNGKLKGEYQVMIYDPEQQFVKCCSEDCAEALKSENASYLYNLYSYVNRQVIQVLKREDITPEETIERFIKKYDYNYTIEDILDQYKNVYLKGYKYKIDFEMNICIENLEEEIRTLLELD